MDSSRGCEALGCIFPNWVSLAREHDVNAQLYLSQSYTQNTISCIAFHTNRYAPLKFSFADIMSGGTLAFFDGLPIVGMNSQPGLNRFLLRQVGEENVNDASKVYWPLDRHQMGLGLEHFQKRWPPLSTDAQEALQS